MKFSHAQRPHFTSILIILFIALQVSACDTDDRINAITNSTDIDTRIIDGTNTNNTTTFSGIDSGSVTEDNDMNNNKLLEISGKLNATDSASNEVSFITNTITGNYGNLIIDTAGNWNYAADNNQAVIQNLARGATLTDKLTVSSVNGATHTIVITIIGADEPGISPAPSNQPALISGIDTGSVIEDVDPDNDNLLVCR